MSIEPYREIFGSRERSWQKYRFPAQNSASLKGVSTVVRFRASILVILAFAFLGTGAPWAAHAQYQMALRSALLRLLNFSVDYVGGKAVDAAIESVVEDRKRLELRIAELERTSRASSASQESLRSELRVLQQTLRTLDLALATRGRPTPSQYHEFQAGLESIDQTLRDHDLRITRAEAGLAQATESIATLREELAALKRKAGPEGGPAGGTGGNPAVPVLYGKSYHVARELLIAEGWIPDKNHWLHGNDAAVRSGNGPQFWERGYSELEACSGTGYGYCRFEFTDPSGRLLVVITEGEESPSHPATVSAVRFEQPSTR